MLELVLFETHGGDLLVGAIDILREGRLSARSGGTRLLQLGLEVKDRLGLGLDLLDKILDALLDRCLREIWNPQGGRGILSTVQSQLSRELFNSV